MKTNKFHIAHFPVGTVVEYENPFNRFLSEDQRVHPEESYERSTAVVCGVRSNGPNSWLVEFAEPSEVGGGCGQTNIQWVRKIVSRGNGKLLSKDQQIVDQLREAQKAEMAKHNVVFRDTAIANSTVPTPGNCYGIYDMRSFLHCYTLTHPLYKVTNGQHYINFDKLLHLVLARLPQFKPENYFDVKSVNKKKFARIFKAAYAHSKTNQRAVERVNAALDAEHYAREMELDD